LLARGVASHGERISRDARLAGGRLQGGELRGLGRGDRRSWIRLGGEARELYVQCRNALLHAANAHGGDVVLIARGAYPPLGTVGSIPRREMRGARQPQPFGRVMRRALGFSRLPLELRAEVGELTPPRMRSSRGTAGRVGAAAEHDDAAGIGQLAVGRDRHPADRQAPPAIEQ